jgi:hypothetical protein
MKIRPIRVPFPEVNDYPQTVYMLGFLKGEAIAHFDFFQKLKNHHAKI